MSGSADRRRPFSGDRLFGVARDVRALGIGAPLRAGYEASKRFGGHAFVFRHLVPTSAEFPQARSPFENRDVPNAVRDGTLAAADRIATGTIDLFGRELRLGETPEWHAVIHTEGMWPVVNWWKIDLRSDERIGDVKWAWELGRHRHLVILARAAHLDASNVRYVEILNRHLDSWMHANPPEIGVHWYSNLEISLRALTWMQILALVGDRLDPEIQAEMWRHLYHSGRHLTADLPYTVSTMRNNHLLGDALGLIALGKAFGGRSGDRWVSIGDRIFNRQLARHMRADGSMIEDSVSYHRFVLEMLSMRVILGEASDGVHESMRNAAQFLARLGVLEGLVPQYGDWDEGRLFAMSENPADLAGSVCLALALAGDGAPEEWRVVHDEVAWFVGEGTAVLPESAETDGNDLGAGIGRVAVGPFTVWLKGGSGPSHGHADLSSVAIAHNGRWLIGDPGTGTYNGPLEERNYFRSSRSHDVLRVAGEDQLVPHRAFRWVHQAGGTIGDPIRFGGTIVMWAVHDAYTRLVPPRRVVRVVKVSPTEIEVIDYLEGPQVAVNLALPLHPQASWDEATSTIELGGEGLVLEPPSSDVTATSGREDPYAGWWSDTYGTAAAATVIDVRCDSGDPIEWVVRSRDESGFGVLQEDPRAFVPIVLFDDTGVRLRIEIDGRTFLRST